MRPVLLQPTFAPIELRAGLGVVHKDVIDSRLAEDERTADRVLPPLSKAVSTEAEKRKLQAVFQFKGGKALPEELTLAPVDGHLPLDVLSSAAAVHKRRQGKVVATAATVTQEQVLHATIMEVRVSLLSASTARQGFNSRAYLLLQIAAEIEERQAYIEDMRRLGGSKSVERAVASEIQSRVTELNKLNAELDRMRL